MVSFIPWFFPSHEKKSPKKNKSNVLHPENGWLAGHVSYLLGLDIHPGRWTAGSPPNHPFGKEDYLNHPPWLCSMLIFQGVYIFRCHPAVLPSKKKKHRADPFHPPRAPQWHTLEDHGTSKARTSRVHWSLTNLFSDHGSHRVSLRNPPPIKIYYIYPPGKQHIRPGEKKNHLQIDIALKLTRLNAAATGLSTGDSNDQLIGLPKTCWVQSCSLHGTIFCNSGIKWMFSKKKTSPNHPILNRVFHYFHHPFWGKQIRFLETPRSISSQPFSF